MGAGCLRRESTTTATILSRSGLHEVRCHGVDDCLERSLANGCICLGKTTMPSDFDIAQTATPQPILGTASPMDLNLETGQVVGL